MSASAEQAAAALSVAAPSSTAVSPLSTPSAAQRCDKDSLSVIFSFCQELSVVLAAALSCRSWRAAAVLRRSSCRAYASLSFYGLLAMLQSPLRFHLTDLEVNETVGGDELTQLSERCPQLEKLTLPDIDGSAIVALTQSDADTAAFNAHAWPPALRSLEIYMFDEPLVALQQLVNALPISAPALQSLVFWLEDNHTGIDFTPLLQLPHLSCLTMRSYDRLSMPQLAIVKQLRTLTEHHIRDG
jgi:hypothetical protein